MDIRKLTRDERQELYDAVLLLALRLARSRTIAEDLTQQAFLRLDTTRPWDKSRSTSLEKHMFGILKSLLSHQRASDAARTKLERETETERAVLSDARRSPEVISLELARREEEEAIAKRRVAALRASLAGFELDLRILDCMSDGVTKRAHLVSRTGKSLDEVKTALARIRRHMDNILAAEGGEAQRFSDEEGK